MKRPSSRAHALLRPSFGLCAALTALVSLGCDQKKVAPAPPPPNVLVDAARRRDIPVYLDAVATLDGYVNADIRARVRGYLKTQDYKDGAFVKAGDPLFTIEATEYIAAVNEAKAAVARAKVASEHNKVQFDRYQGLFQTGTVSQQDVDNTKASVDDAKAQIQSAQAQLEQANLNLSYTQIRSPLSGVAGLALVRVGNLVGQDGPTLLTTVSSLDPIRVTFPMSEVDYVRFPDRFKHFDQRDIKWAKAQFAKLEQTGMADGDDPGLELVLSDGSTYGRRGVIVTANRQIDPSTGTIQLQALVPNPDGILRPGQFGRVRLRRSDVGTGVIAISEKALISVQGTYSVGVVGADNKVSLRRVEVGPSVSGLRLINSGLTEGDRVVVEGVQKISDGATVVPKQAPEPAASGSGAAGSAPSAAPPTSGVAAKN